MPSGATEVLLAAIILMFFVRFAIWMAKLLILLVFALALGFAYMKGGEQALQLIAVGEIVLLVGFYAAKLWIRRMRSAAAVRR